MSEVQRWNINHVLGRVYIDEKSEGGWVTYADHVAAVAAAEQRAGEQAHGHYMDGYNKAWSLSAAEIERQVREEEQVAQTLARAELYSMEEMDERCTQAADEAFAVGVQAARDAVTAVQAECGYDAAINWSEIDPRNEYAEGWTDLLSLILPAIDALRGGS